MPIARRPQQKIRVSWVRDSRLDVTDLPPRPLQPRLPPTKCQFRLREPYEQATRQRPSCTRTSGVSRTRYLPAPLEICDLERILAMELALCDSVGDFVDSESVPEKSLFAPNNRNIQGNVDRLATAYSVQPLSPTHCGAGTLGEPLIRGKIVLDRGVAGQNGGIRWGEYGDTIGIRTLAQSCVRHTSR
jgi:hypothetical protein